MKTPDTPPFGPADLQYTENVSRETMARLMAFVGLLEDWNSRHNLVSRASLAEVWRRHIFDSAQLLEFIPPATRSLVDLGSGAGFPGLVLAILLEGGTRPPPPPSAVPLPHSLPRTGEQEDHSRASLFLPRAKHGGGDREAGGGGNWRIVLYEATRKKCEFLRAAAERVGAKVEVRDARIEDARPEAFDVVTARALAPLDDLLAYAQPFQGPHTTNLFLKGQSVGDELTESRKSWRMRVERHPSRSDPSGVVLAIRDLSHA